MLCFPTFADVTHSKVTHTHADSGVGVRLPGGVGWSGRDAVVAQIDERGHRGVAG